MSFRILLSFIGITFCLSCGILGKNKKTSKIKNTSLIEGEKLEEYKIISINCDTIYKNKHYSLELTSINSIQEEDNKTRAFIFRIIKLLNSQTIEIYKDTIQSITQEVLFVDYNNDGIKDVLIQNTSDVRSNQTYNLFLVDIKKDKIKKVRGFNIIKNPNFLTKYNLIDNYVLSGREWTSFYKIQSDSIVDFGTVIYNTHSDDGLYEADYKRAIEDVLAKESIKD